MRRVSIGWLLGAACTPAMPVPVPLPEQTQPGPGAPSTLASEPFAPPADAARLGWMPLVSTNVPAFRDRHPDEDGRGVLIAILDSGIDPAAPGLDRTSIGLPKLLDVRDFSGEGRIALREVTLEGDSVRWAPGWRERADCVPSARTAATMAACCSRHRWAGRPRPM